jgi:hypothetical protein
VRVGVENPVAVLAHGWMPDSRAAAACGARQATGVADERSRARARSSERRARPVARDRRGGASLHAFNARARSLVVVAEIRDWSGARAAASGCVRRGAFRRVRAAIGRGIAHLPARRDARRTGDAHCQHGAMSGRGACVFAIDHYWTGFPRGRRPRWTVQIAKHRLGASTCVARLGSAGVRRWRAAIAYCGACDGAAAAHEQPSGKPAERSHGLQPSIRHGRRWLQAPVRTSRRRLVAARPRRGGRGCTSCCATPASRGSGTPSRADIVASSSSTW